MALVALLAVGCQSRSEGPSVREAAAESAAPDAAIARATPPLRPAWTLSTTLEAPPVPVPPGVTNVTIHTPEGFDP